MLGTWSKSWVFQGTVILVLLLLVASFFMKSSPPDKADREFDVKIREALGYVAAEEASKSLGAEGGEVVLLLAPVETPEAFERGFRKGIEKSRQVQLVAAVPLKAQGFDFYSLAPYQDARKNFPTARLLVSFVDMPHFDDEQRIQWIESPPPKLITLERFAPDPAALERLFQEGLVDAVIVRKRDIPYPKRKPKDLREIFELFYEVIRPAKQGLNP